MWDRSELKPRRDQVARTPLGDRTILPLDDAHVIAEVYRPEKGETCSTLFPCVDPLFAGLRRSAAQWTRTQRIRTAASMTLEAMIIDPADLPIYVRIGANAQHLRGLGMSDRAIARVLQVSDKTVAKAHRGLATD